MSRYIRPHIARMAGYVPGEQPQEGGFIKLNTNENPYPPSPKVKAALAEAISDRLRLYPDPMATEFRRTVAELHGVEPDMVLAGNGSDDLLTILTRAFVGRGDLAAYPSPSYLLYSTLIAFRMVAQWLCRTRPTGRSRRVLWRSPDSNSSSWPIPIVRRGRRSHVNRSPSSRARSTVH